MGKKLNKNYNKILLDVLSERPVAYLPILASIAGSATAGLFLSQLLYWRGKGIRKDWIFKTIDETFAETHLNRSEQDRAIKIWSGLGVLEKIRRGIPPKRNFKINFDRLLEVIAKHSGKSLDSLKSATQFAEQDDTISQTGQNITESTQRKLTEILF